MTSVQKEDLSRAASCRLEWDKLYGKTVLVTGATGFIGAFIIRTILLHAEINRQMVRIIAVVRDIERAEAMFGQDDRIRYIGGDITEPICYKERLDYVMHCASNAAPDLYLHDPVGTMKTNFYGTVNALDCARACGAKRFLYVSTIEVFGRTDTPGLLTEESFGYISPLNVRSCYPESKKCCESLAVCYGEQYGIDVVIGRLSYIYGAGMSRTDTKVCALFARETAAKRDIILKSRGEQRRSYTYVSDAVTGLLAILLSGEAGSAYNVASPDSVVSIAELADLHCRLFPEQGTTVRYEIAEKKESSRFSFIADAVMDPAKLMKLGWKAEVSTEDGIRAAVRHNMEQNQADSHLAEE